MLNPTITPPTNRPEIAVGDHVFLEGTSEPIGGIRSIRPKALLVYVEGAGDFLVPLQAIRAARYGKVVLDPAQLDERFLDAARAAHTRETD